jgi:hypothetical protein
MKTPRKLETVAAGLTVAERMLLFCVASSTSWQSAGVTAETLTKMGEKGLIQRDTVGRSSLTAKGRAALRAEAALESAFDTSTVIRWRSPPSMMPDGTSPRRSPPGLEPQQLCRGLRSAP